MALEAQINAVEAKGAVDPSDPPPFLCDALTVPAGEETRQQLRSFQTQAPLTSHALVLTLWFAGAGGGREP